MNKKLLHLFLIIGCVLTGQIAKSQEVTPVYQVDTLATFDQLGPEFETIIYDGAIWKRREGAVPSGSRPDRYISGSPGIYYERYQSGSGGSAQRVASGDTIWLRVLANNTGFATAQDIQVLGPDGSVYQKRSGTLPTGQGKYYQGPTGNYFERVSPILAEDGFYKVKTMADLKNLSSEKVANIKNNLVKGVVLLGYRKQGDTPAPIYYYLSDTTASDDGGSVVEVADIKLVHDFEGLVNPLYYGAQTGLTQAMLSKPGTLYLITGNLDLKNATITLPESSKIKMAGGTLKNGTVKNNFISINSSSTIAEKDFKLYDNYVYLSNNVTINISYLPVGAFTIESDGVATINIGQVAFYNSNVTIRNCRFVKGLGAFKFLNRDSLQYVCEINIENCAIRQDPTGTDPSDDSWSVVVGSNLINRADIAEKHHVKFTCRNTTFTNIGLTVLEVDADISRCRFTAGLNNKGNRELIHMAGGSTRLNSAIKDCIFDANGIYGDLVDLYNSSNKVIDRCRFKGAVGANYITIKSHINGGTPGIEIDTKIDSDQIGAQSNIIISSCLFEGKASRDYGAIAIYNDDRKLNKTETSFAETLKRYNVKVDKCTFKLDDDSTAIGNRYAAAVALGNTRWVSITNNTVVIPQNQRSVLANCLYQPSEDIIISGNVLKNLDQSTSLSSKLIGKTVGRGFLRNSVIDNNIVQRGYILNDKVPWTNLTLTNNSSLNVINTDSADSVLTCYRAGNKNNGVFNDNYGPVRPPIQSVPIGFTYFDTILGMSIWRKTNSEWVDAMGNIR